MAYIDQYNLAMSDDFQHRILIALLNTGRKAMVAPVEPPPEEPVEGEEPVVDRRARRKAARMGFIRTLLTEPDRYLRMVALAAVTVQGVTETVTDAQLQTVVDNLFDLFAGAQEG